MAQDIEDIEEKGRLLPMNKQFTNTTEKASRKEEVVFLWFVPFFVLYRN